MTTNITNYLREIETELPTGNATEHTYRPALKAFVESLAEHITATNEPRHVACGAPDFCISRKTDHEKEIIGYIETKDVGASLDQAERTDQLKRYLAGLRNLILTDYLDFRWYVDGKLRRVVRLANWNGIQLSKVKDGVDNLEALLKDFLAHTPQEISSPAELAQRMARLALLIRESIVLSFEQEQASNLLQGWRDAFAKVLIADLNQPGKVSEFADMFAQTLAYGLFSARTMDTSPGFNLAEAQHLIPKTNPFLRRFFFEITGPYLEDEPFAGYVTDLVALLDHTDIHAVLAGFGKRSKLEDPTVHFYETFLKAYDPKLRELRGVYFTPQPVVDFIVRAIDDILKTRFGLKDGLADTTSVTIPDITPGAPKGAKKTLPKVLILDPAAGTATFPYAVIDLIRQSFMHRNNAGLWNGYVREQLLPRLFGFELLMAPYAVAHFRLAMQLAAYDLPESQRADWAYHFTGDERINVFLTNTLEEPHEWTGLPLFTQFLADETIQANYVKQDLPIMVILGNPPYSANSTNKGKWITDLIHNTYYPKDDIKEANPKLLLDDYVKFVCWAQKRIEYTGNGILGFITNHSYLDNPTFRTMRQSLTNTFNEIYILNLHGNVIRKDRSPNGSIDENIFDIQQGVTISLFIKLPDKHVGCSIFYAEFWGTREKKYEQLLSSEINDLSWKKIITKSPYFLFIPQDTDLMPEYEGGWKLTDIFPQNSTGIKTHRDHFVIDFSISLLKDRINKFRDLSITDEVIKQTYKLNDTSEWKINFKRKSLNEDQNWQNRFSQCLYRPFDLRDIFYHSDVIDRARTKVMDHLLNPNLSLLAMRRIRLANYNHFFVSNRLVCKDAVSIEDACYIFPLYLYNHISSKRQKTIFDDFQNENIRTPNLNPEFLNAVRNNTKLQYIPDGSGDLEINFEPEDIFCYIYSIFYSPTYRSRYAEFLKVDFPRVPLTHNLDLFRNLCRLGGELVSLHLLESSRVKDFITSYPIPGENRVERGYPIYYEQLRRVNINPKQYFEGIQSEVWEFKIGGYQVLDKWLKDRRGRLLTYEDLTHYQKVVVALCETIRLMREIDQAIPDWPIE
jgi:predicted helicase